MEFSTHYVGVITDDLPEECNTYNIQGKQQEVSRTKPELQGVEGGKMSAIVIHTRLETLSAATGSGMK